jgi:preprotein translocase subunit SecE
VARQTRSERRARRAAQAESQAAVERSRVRPTVRPPVQQAGAQDGARAHHERHFPGTRFVSEAWGELQKVEWPGQQQLIQGTAVVLIACLIVGLYLWASDEVFKRLVQHVLLR